MKFSFLSILLSVVLLSCQEDNGVGGKRYHGYWYETSYTFEFRDNQAFVLSYNGHYSVGETKGEYMVLGDTLHIYNVDNERIIADRVLSERYIIDTLNDCIIDPYMKFDYCHRDEHYSDFRAIEYPQLNNDSRADAAFIDSILLFGIDSLLSLRQDTSDKLTPLYIKRYYSAGKTLDRVTSVKGRLIHVVEEPHPNIHWDKEYISIDKINWNREQSVLVEMGIYPNSWDDALLLSYYYEDGQYWLRKQ